MALEICKLWKCEKKCEWCFLVFRVIIGLLFAMHGAMKFGFMSDFTISGFAGAMSIPVWLGVIAGLVELIGGIAIVLGLFTRVFATLGGIQMIVAFIMGHMPNGLNPFTNGGELVVVFFASMLLLFGYGAGKFSLDSLLCKKCK
ncbi:DoxX family protein [Candidatus Woesearchaeota archaeon]|nr:DoxX family protein [Candidatus Woesearchaeota archaeon]MBT5271719.1 DoxX family protein [Candidatus Woesearchaeota archaeon]MBT6041092.1 DoxX family protein [Candidatus Woesearchaeota archaeon]MBT6337417.1 DoxX family protein [Candidatus Woesearchaeota archaeon]MBT7926923.1 DoxX family protein [Candidatus Woesearchaeota archaeon]